MSGGACTRRPCPRLEETGSDDWAALAHHAHAAGRLDEMVAAARKGASSYLRSGATYQALRLAELALHEGEADAELLELATLASWSVGLLATAVERAEQWRVVRLGTMVTTRRWPGHSVTWHGSVGDREPRGPPPGGGRSPRGRSPARHRAKTGPGSRTSHRRRRCSSGTPERRRLGGRGDGRSRARPFGGSLRAAVLVNKGSTLLDMRRRRRTAESRDAPRGPGRRPSRPRTTRARFGRSTTCPTTSCRFGSRPGRVTLLEQMREVIGRTGRQDWWDNWTELKAIFLAHVEGDLSRCASDRPSNTSRCEGGGGWLSSTASSPSRPVTSSAPSSSFPLPAQTPRPGPAGAADRGYALGLSARSLRGVGDTAAVTDLLTQLAGIVEQPRARPQSTFSDAWHGAMSRPAAAASALEQVGAVSSDF